jgi:anthranilate phosphoribosyltransferase
MSIVPLTRKLLERKHLTREEASAAAEEIFQEQVTPVQIASFLTALHAQGETTEAIVGFAEVLRQMAEPFHAPEGTIIDTCGTGGDHSGTFNISTAVAFVVAGCGVRVAKHGNRSVTSQCGSADVLAQLGVRIDAPPHIMERALEQIGICFLFAPLYHKAMRVVASIRRELGFRTIFNLLGPVLNPAQVSHQLVGVYSLSGAEMIARALSQLGTQRALAIYSSDGLDEISTVADAHGIELRDGTLTSLTISARHFGLQCPDASALRGGSLEDNAKIIRDILSGERGPRRDIVLLNAGAALYVSGAADSIGQGIELAADSISQGRALEKLRGLIEITNEMREA